MRAPAGSSPQFIATGIPRPVSITVRSNWPRISGAPGFGSRVVEADFRNRGLLSIPESIYDVPDLQRLYLDENRLTSLPDGIHGLTNLETLHARGNQLTSISKQSPRISQRTQPFPRL